MTAYLQIDNARAITLNETREVNHLYLAHLVFCWFWAMVQSEGAAVLVYRGAGSSDVRRSASCEDEVTAQFCDGRSPLKTQDRPGSYEGDGASMFL